MSINILVVEDELSFQKIVEQYFKDQIKSGKYNFYFADNGKKALEVVVKNKFIDLVVLDIKMPKIDGLELLKLLDYFNLKMEIIIISAYGDMNMVRQAMNVGASDFLSKPFSMKTLAKAIKDRSQKVTAKNLGYIEKRALHNRGMNLG